MLLDLDTSQGPPTLPTPTHPRYQTFHFMFLSPLTLAQENQVPCTQETRKDSLSGDQVFRWVIRPCTPLTHTHSLASLQTCVYLDGKGWMGFGFASHGSRVYLPWMLATVVGGTNDIA
ncbi:hypothetical protein WAI453_004158 [Rhynchosporium graminicola]